MAIASPPEQILLSWKLKRFQFNKIGPYINMLEQIHAPK
jgi:hypothetical protein